MVKRFKGWTNVLKRIDFKLQLTDTFRYFANCYFITVTLCICYQNGWLPFLGKKIVTEVEFAEIISSLFCVIPIIMFWCALRGRYTIIAIMDFKLKPTGRAKQSVSND